MKKILVILVLLIVPLGFSQQASTVQPEAADIIMQFPNVRDFTISPSLNEAYFTAQSILSEISVIIKIEKQMGEWAEPKIVPFSGKYRDMEPFLSPDGLRLFFASDRPLYDSIDKPKDFDIWYVERNDNNSNWSIPINIGSPINTDQDEFYPSLSNNHNLYFTCDFQNSKNKDDIYFSKRENGKYLPPVALNDSINSEGYEFNSFIAPDESYIIFTGYNREDGLGSGDLYISYKIADDKWSKAKNMGAEINSDKMDFCPFVDANSNTLFFTSKRSQLNENPQSFTSAKDLLGAINKYENGSSRIYKVFFEPMK